MGRCAAWPPRSSSARPSWVSPRPVPPRPGTKWCCRETSWWHGATRRATPLRLLAPTALITKLWVWVAISSSTLLLGILLLLLAPRAADAVFATVRDRTGPSVWWGLGLLVGLPIASVLTVLTVVGIPF